MAKKKAHLTRQISLRLDPLTDQALKGLKDKLSARPTDLIRDAIREMAGAIIGGKFAQFARKT